MNTNKMTDVVIVDDHPLFRRGVVELLNDSGEFNVLADFEGGQQLLEALDELSPELLLLDMHMPELSGLQLFNELKLRGVQQKIIFLTASDDSSELFAAISAGANGYLLKDSSPEQIINGLKDVMQGNIAIDNTGVTMLAQHLRKEEEQPQSVASTQHADLTERELQTLELITRGMSNKLIARELGISDGTVKVYVKNLLRKLNVNSRLELAAWAHANQPLPESER
ncbi:response regulator [Amphritea sp. 1_MG-2023]|uniref:response regulator n=1 Tax=Amphritea sp. 1_MG-2023 TaxID=3062670 RepID=UPI0026E26B90|nr:response regulator [Amphritea sp. 1_MG-2023]MDO6564979.1 response regulator [Amphritea sp. 1_MG-2023]